jgi:transcriptional regulator with PAS, ATPase and Fis domain
MNTQQIKQRFGIIGTSQALSRALEIAVQVAPTDISVLITGESGVGKEIMPQVIHNLSARKHGPYIAVNCGAIPEGTIDSELFGHEKGSFTGAHDSRKGYFEVANGGTIFLDEVAELPLQTQVRLLRVLETGEFMKVGSSKVQKTDVRIIAATNVTIPAAIDKGKFREDLYYRLNTVPIYLPPLRNRKEDIHLLFRKFAADFAEKYNMPPLKLTDDAKDLLENYYWPGNIRQLRNITEQISVIEHHRDIDGNTLRNYLPNADEKRLPAIIPPSEKGPSEFSEREILYKVLFEMRQDISDLKSIVLDLIQNQGNKAFTSAQPAALRRLFDEDQEVEIQPKPGNGEIAFEFTPSGTMEDDMAIIQQHEDWEESLSLQDSERDLIQKALKKHRNRRKLAAQELGISERTLYRKIKEYDIE